MAEIFLFEMIAFALYGKFNNNRTLGLHAVCFLGKDPWTPKCLRRVYVIFYVARTGVARRLHVFPRQTGEWSARVAN